MQMSTMFTSGKKTLSEQAYESIRDSILTLRLKPGQTIYESELAGMLEMSRTPVREAVRILLVEELIEVLPQRGMKIALISERKVEDTRYVRELLEVGSIRGVVRSWSSDEPRCKRLLRDLEMNLELQRQVEEEGDFEEFLRLDEVFHRFLMGVTGNNTLISIVTQMRSHLNRVRSLTLKELKNAGSLTDEHQQLIDALKEKDESQMVAILTKHLRRLNDDMKVMKQAYPSYFAEH
ncbi:GntR family transcriptional regulator [Alicyclobacillus sp. SO9]|uniref:GntR family transcriptional regulator n=1 Tax=Alicyclobacillus sp. SO9 TaxID=2665646 RepID=UPI0018E8F026|nr:GntR family transcriptional regulator [Alicyclobacillus sp. SO9]QQE77916.1 GntR family transcriptional regulator [Alicyclobacillus sp. SO9]